MSTSPRVLPTQEGYDRWSAIYDAESNPLIVIEQPHVTRLLGDVSGRKVLDVGCGTGRHSVALAARGAVVTGVDFSSGMLAKARSKPGAAGVTFLQQDASGKLPFESGSFHRVISCLVVDHVQDLAGFFGELKRVVRADGFVVISVMHPAMMLKGVQARFSDPNTGEEVRPQSVANQISDYVMGATRAGFTFDELSEHAIGPDIVATTPRAEKYLGWPMLFLMKLRP